MSPSFTPTAKPPRFENSRNVEMTGTPILRCRSQENYVMYDRKRTARVGVTRIRASESSKMIYFAKPRRRRSSLPEIPPSFFNRALDRSIIFKNFRFVLSATVSSSAFRIGMTAANGFPRLTTMIGSFLAFSAYAERGPDAFLNSTFVIA